MPKIVDADARREEIAAAVWRVVRRAGLPAASVRSVAREAGWSMGALRHYFVDHDEMLTAAMELVARRATERAKKAHVSARDPRAAASAMLEELLPLDDERRAEAEVWLAFTSRSLTNTEMGDLRRRTHDAIHSACLAVAAEQLAETSTDASESALLANQLHAVLDGLALHAITHPTALPPHRIRQVLAAQLDIVLDRGDIRPE